MPKPSVLMIGLEPEAIDFSDPFFGGRPGMDADAVRAGIGKAAAAIEALGCEVQPCAVDGGPGTEAVLRAALAERAWDVVSIGAGVRLWPAATPILERIVNTVHAAAPQAKFCFNTGLPDTADAVKRWLPAG